MAKRKPASTKRIKLPEVGSILHLEHFNFVVQDHDMVTTFFMNGLGFTRDPFRRADETNIGVSVGMQQFHLPRRGDTTPPFAGEVGLVVPGIPAIKARLRRLQRMGKFKATPYRYEANNGTPLVTSPFGIRLRLHSAGSIPFQRPLGIAYVDISIEPGKAQAIARFYRQIMGAPAVVKKIGGETSAVVTVGAFQYLRFRERRRKDYDLHNAHVAYYVTGYNERREMFADKGSMVGLGQGQVFNFHEIFDPENGETVLKFQQELRSVYHPDFMRPLVNRWPIINEPYVDQANIVAELPEVPQWVPGA